MNLHIICKICERYESCKECYYTNSHRCQSNYRVNVATIVHVALVSLCSYWAQYEQYIVANTECNTCNIAACGNTKRHHEGAEGHTSVRLNQNKMRQNVLIRPSFSHLVAAEDQKVETSNPMTYVSGHRRFVISKKSPQPVDWFRSLLSSSLFEESESHTLLFSPCARTVSIDVFLLRPAVEEPKANLTILESS
jgi:hypothetical protein